MSENFLRTRMLFGSEAMEALAKARVAVFGLGGVGGHVCEALVRSGIGAFDIIDGDVISATNLNRQIIATRKTLGLYKADVMRDRMLDINPDADVKAYKYYVDDDNISGFKFRDYDYVVDAVDTVRAKVAIILSAQAAQAKVMSAMGAGNKLDPTRLKVADIYDTNICPLARVMRREMRKNGVSSLKVVYSDELPRAVGSIPASTAYVPAAAGLIIASEVVNDLTRKVL